MNTIIGFDLLSSLFSEKNNYLCDSVKTPLFFVEKKEVRRTEEGGRDASGGLLAQASVNLHMQVRQIM